MRERKKAPVLSDPKRGQGHTDERAEFWRVTPRTVRRWLAHRPPVPVDDIAAMLAWVASLPATVQGKLSPSFRRRVAELRLVQERAAGGAPDDPDRAAFLATRQAADSTPAARGAHDTTFLATLKLERDFALFKLQRANTTNNLPVLKDTQEAITRLSGVIHDEELRAQKLGREIGDIIPRPDYERQLRALAYWLVRSVDATLATLAPALAARSATGPLFREEVRALLEPVLLTTRVLDPLRRSADLPAGTGAALPPWALNALTAALAACIENPDASEFQGVQGIKPPIIQVTEAPSAPPAAASAAPSDSGRDDPKSAGEATASHSQPGSVSNQTAGDENQNNNARHTTN